MKPHKGVSLLTRLVYCMDCRSRDTFERQPDKDVKTESGKVFLECWECQNCKHQTWYPAESSSGRYETP